MPSYYNGNIQEDLMKFSELSSFSMFVPELRRYGRKLGFGRMQQLIRQPEHSKIPSFEVPVIENLRYLEKQWGADTLCKVIQVLWAEYLSESGDPIMGALYFDPVIL
jgi:hypothetical protein